MSRRKKNIEYPISNVEMTGQSPIDLWNKSGHPHKFTSKFKHGDMWGQVNDELSGYEDK